MKKRLLLCLIPAGLGLALALAARAETPLQIAALDSDRQSTLAADSGIWKALNPGKLKLRSAAALVVDDAGNEVYAKQASDPMPIASITKLMTAMVVTMASSPCRRRSPSPNRIAT